MKSRRTRKAASADTASARGSADDLRGYEVVVAVCGGIAAYKVCTVVSRLAQRGAGVTAVMTEAATKFVTPLTFESLTLRRVFTSAWESEGYHDPQHLRLTESADLFLVAPCTANMIGKIACGIADDLVSTMVMSTDCPVLLAPAMNTRMWDNPIVQDNVKTLAKAGFEIIPPAEGWLACRTVGAGRLQEPEEIIERVIAQLTRKRPRNQT